MLTVAPAQKPHRTKEEYVYDTLRNAIMRCELEPGDKLVMDSLSAELGVSPIPIRGALQRLQAEGLVQIVPHTGTIVSPISPGVVDEVFLLLEHLERIAFRVAADKATAADITNLRSRVDEMEQAFQSGNSDEWSELNNRFHRAVAQISQMNMLIEFTTRTLDSWDRLRRYYLKSIVTLRMTQAQAEHHQMIELMEQRDADGLVALVNQHNRLAKEAYWKVINTLQSQ